MAAPEPPLRTPDTLVSTPRGPSSRIVLMAGVAGACLLGATAGAWVRPEAEDLRARQTAGAAHPTAAPAAPPAQMRIVVDAGALPDRPLLEVMPRSAPEPPAPAPEPPARLIHAKAEPETAPAAAEVKPPKARKTETKAEKATTAEKPAKPKADKVVTAKADRPKRKTPEKAVELAKAEPQKKPTKAQKAKPEKKVELAKAEAKPPKAKRDKEKRDRRKAEPAKADRTLLAKADAKPKAKTAPKAVQLAKAEPKPVKPAKAQPKPAVRLAAAPPPARKADPPPKAAPPKAALPPVQHARAPENPWAEEDRRLARAYRRAAEAGVPEWRLARQQARWQRARDAAAREAPWAVPEVYDARIAELDDLAGEAAMEWN